MRQPSLAEILTYPYAQAWLHACAHHVAVSYCRALGRNLKRLVSLEAVFENDEDQVAYLPDAAPLPETVFFRKEFRRLLSKMEGISPDQQRLLLRHLVDEENYDTLTSEFGTTSHALRQRYTGARRHLVAFLESQGWTAAELLVLFADGGP